MLNRNQNLIYKFKGFFSNKMNKIYSESSRSETSPTFSKSIDILSRGKTMSGLAGTSLWYQFSKRCGLAHELAVSHIRCVVICYSIYE